MDRGEFAHRVIVGLGATTTNHVRSAMQAQLQVEGGHAKFNPYNTTWEMPGSTPYNFVAPGVAVQNYVSPRQGQEATIKTFRSKGHGYERIIKLMKEDAPAWQICVAIVESDWGTGEAVTEDDHPLILAVLEDIRHKRTPNRLSELESRPVAS